MSLTLYNTLTRRKEPFTPIDPKNVRMYVCGPTVYDYAHIGNARPVIVFDVLFRLLRHVYGADHVTYVRNITDVDDKINARAAEEGISIRELTERTASQFHEDIAALSILPPTVEPRATEHIDEMKALCEALVAKGHAYVAEGHVLFDVASMPDYGRLSNRSLDEMEAGARVEVAPYKKGPMDFVLWKPSKEGEPGWPSPCGIEGAGRPGWHIECSAMSDRWLWEEVKDKLSNEAKARPHQFDIHGGGIDLTFPHHENEVAQSRCAHGTPVMANVWMHNGFLQVEGEKMSKSLGNFITIHELLKTDKFGGRRWPGEVLRLAMLMTHYRQPIDFTATALEAAEKVLRNWYRLIGDATACEAGDGQSDVQTKLQDDLNTPQAITALHAMADALSNGGDASALARFKSAANLLGLLTMTQSEWLAAWNADAKLDEGEIEARITARLEARKAKNWAESDRIRDELAEMGIQLKDAKDPTTGEFTTTWEVMR
ncbi:cysteinyl-tRNA synthetase [Filomicrobium insigne]|uniref:Cysteine--tRNA ligase n=1 Tax=Filomicrobium insigne TaxID=418854 RepID=A0A1H0QZ54_9HYPH|nr:cysteine--tRNA ligase [Filomicrobium insigne]SDP22551.1 cysteinyl-tRNA synthetase [Filomicrobium insigne]